MLAIPGIVVASPIHESSNSLVYRAIAQEDFQPVIVKILRAAYPSPESLVRYKQEFEITYNFNAEGVIKAYKLEKYQNTLFIIFEDFGGDSLKILMRKHTFTLEEFLIIAIKITQALGQIHAANIIHKDINPSNIVFNPVSGQLKIIDFGISSILNRENSTIKNPELLEGTLAYISPEQTGRMNRSIDYRTDFYSLGATFYELLTQKLPFAALDAMELVHCHIARQPVPPHDLIPSIPQVVSDIVMKLLSKTAEERYQSARGIQLDLENCFKQLQKLGIIESFPLVQQDISGKFQIPQKLYGREKEVATLLAAFKRATQRRSELLLVAGYSGIGKSALVQEIYKPITAKRGYFVSGKFDQLERNIPYSAFLQALAELMRQLLTESEAQINYWKQRLQTALGSNGQVIVDVLPEVELIIGKQLKVPELDPTETQNRFNFVFYKFISAMLQSSGYTNTQAEHPLVIFLDDLQWADLASLKLIQLLMTQLNDSSLLLISAYRDNEVSATHPLSLMLKEIQASGTAVTSIYLAPLGVNTINQLLTETLMCDELKSAPLAELVIKRTQGNPFFVREFLQSLYTKNLFNFDNSQGQWQWDIEQVELAPVADNIIELISQKIQLLSPATQQLLKLAACIGYKFDTSILSKLSNTSQKQTAHELFLAVNSGLIVALDNNYKLLSFDEASQDVIAVYRFVHDRIQQAAYSLIFDKDKPIIHLQIGQLILQNVPEAELENKIFEIVNQLNLGLNVITDSKNKELLISLNQIAATKAKASAAFQAAFNYLQVALKLLQPDCWQHQYQTALSLHEQATEVAYLNSNLVAMERFAEIVLQRAKTVTDCIKVYEVRVIAYTGEGKFRKAIDTGLEALNLLNIRLPKQINKITVLLALLQLRFVLWNKNLEDLITLPQMQDPQSQIVMRILDRIIFPASNTLPLLVPLIMVKQLLLSIKKGNAPESPGVYATYGLILCSSLGDIKLGYQWARAGLTLMEKFNIKKLKPRVLVPFDVCIRVWIEPLKNTLNSLLETHLLSIETGDVESVAVSAFAYCCHLYFTGYPLEKLEIEEFNYSKLFTRIKQERILSLHKLHYQSTLNFMGKSDNPCDLNGQVCEEEIILQTFQNQNYSIGFFTFYYIKLMLCYYFGDYETGEKNAVAIRSSLIETFGSLLKAYFYFYESLNNLALATKVSYKTRRQLLSQVKSNQQKIKKWAHHAPANFLNKSYLVEAEIYRVLGKESLAATYYDRAIALAKQYEYIHEEALAHELAAKFYLEQGKHFIAQAYMLNARHAYQRWGALAKVKDLDSKYPELLSIKYQDTTNKTLTISDSKFGSSAKLDIATVVKASQAISGEIFLDKLLEKLLKIIMENAGAQTGCLIKIKNQELFLEIIGTVEPNWQITHRAIPLTQSRNLPITLINYVARTKSNVILDNAVKSGQFQTDFYIKNRQIKSIACIPIINQNQLISIIYLENNLSIGAFTQERVEILKVLCAQAAISLENAQLYQQLESYSRTLEEKVTERTLELKTKNEQLEQEILERILAEESLRQSERRFQNMAANVPGTIYRYVLHPDGSDAIIYASSYCQDIFEVSPTVAMQDSKVVLSMVHPDDLSSLNNSLKISAQNLQPRYWEGRIITPSGALKWIQIISRPEKQENGDIIWDGLAIDISSRKQAEVKIIQALEKERELAELRSRFVSMTSHEFRTPLNIINSSAQLLERYEWSREEELEQISNIRFSVKQMTQLIDKVLTLSKVDVGKLQFNPERLELVKFCHQLIAEMQFQCSENQKIEFISHRISSEGNQTQLNECITYVDITLLRLVLNNLLSNAIKYSPSGGLIQLRLIQLTSSVVFEVKDTGIGIPVSDQNQLFEQFHRASNVGDISGTGLGLAIVKKCLDLQNGTVTCDSEIGKGTTFRVTLPATIEKKDI